MPTDTLNQLLGTGTLALQVVTLGLIVALLLRKKVSGFNDVISQVGALALPLAFVSTLVSSALTLYYSDVLGFEPCPLCWWQRVFMYPQVILFALALSRNIPVRLISITLSILGLGVALYHHALQMLPSGSLPCPATGPSCSQITLLEYGYITYPLMAATLFAFLIVLMIANRVRS
ncbi:MAG: disulfide bond formation protein B [Candidatus Pacebacteria bacterium]|nr:disulfide bond formation protein B [Candidatus Paceibacterota bacterium]